MIEIKIRLKKIKSKMHDKTMYKLQFVCLLCFPFPSSPIYEASLAPPGGHHFGKHCWVMD